MRDSGDGSCGTAALGGVVLLFRSPDFPMSRSPDFHPHPTFFSSHCKQSTFSIRPMGDPGVTLGCPRRDPGVTLGSPNPNPRTLDSRPKLAQFSPCLRGENYLSIGRGSQTTQKHETQRFSRCATVADCLCQFLL